ncbi:hypothetical protein PHLCEN_2v117 [Hermanssonia centrifuga]|uniref:Extracellular metalloproteinase n=1 Tax=Hermanssonia centrifuga TaxID=98765 RepID=A0A2R6S6Z9_9APHY|nr:hypothetical protein PHLCEN_2v117 [Hermanssonia centrifuga]
MFTRTFFTSVLLAVACASTTLAVPWPLAAKHTTHRVREVSSDLRIETFHPESTYETFGEGIDHPLYRRADDDLEEAAVSFVQSHLGLSDGSISFKSGFAGEAAKHAFVKQKVNGVPLANAVANVAFNNANKVVAFGSSFVKPTFVPSTTPQISLEDAISKAETLLNGKFNEWPATVEFVAQEDGSLALTHVVQIQNDETGSWLEAFIDAHSGKLVQVTDFVTKASYRVLPITKETLPEGFELLVDPQDTTASPDGWHSDGTTTTTTTASQTATTSESSTNLIFDFTQDPTQAPTATNNLNAARVNAFYIVNTIHDISYKYGFTEASFK